MLDDFMIRAIVAGCGVALATGPLGCFVVWRRMAYFGDATAHAALLGVALALALEMPVLWGTLAVALAMAIGVAQLMHRGFAGDTVLGVLSHGALALGLVIASFLTHIRVDLSAFLFGDILAISKTDVGLIFAGAALILALLAWRWNRLILATLSDELSQAAQIRPRFEQFILTLALALLVAAALKIVGALLITAMLIIPAAAARSFARSPEGMAVVATGVGLVSMVAGLQGAGWFDTPAGPSVICAAVFCFALSLVWRGLRGQG